MCLAGGAGLGSRNNLQTSVPGNNKGLLLDPARVHHRSARGSSALQIYSGGLRMTKQPTSQRWLVATPEGNERSEASPIGLTTLAPRRPMSLSFTVHCP